MLFLPLALLAWVSAADLDSLDTLLNPISISQFTTVFNRQAFFVDRRDSKDADAFVAKLSKIEPLVSNISTIDVFLSRFSDFKDGITLHNRNGSSMSQMRGDDLLKSMQQKGISAVLKAEKLDLAHSPLQTSLQHRFSTDVTVHAYVSPGGAQALKVRVADIFKSV